MQRGACDDLTNPFPLNDLEHRCRLAWDRGQLARENQQLKEIIRRSESSNNMIGQSPEMKAAFRLIERVAPTNKAVMIQGESGTGKELVARAIQQNSLRANKPFVTVNCAALPENLVKCELFGHQKGSFTGATIDRPVGRRRAGKSVGSSRRES